MPPIQKGESLPDTIRSLECYSDIIVLRHPIFALRHWLDGLRKAPEGKRNR